MVGKVFNNGEQWSAGVAYIAYPDDIARDEYIRDCYMNHRVSIKTEDGAMSNRVAIDTDVLSYIEFPQTSKELGTAVVYITEPQQQQPIVVARLIKSDQLGDGKEGMFKIRRIFNDKLVEINGDVQEGLLNFNVLGADKKGTIKIELDNDADDCLFDLTVSGDVKINSTGSTHIQNHQEYRSIISDVDADEAEKVSIIKQTTDRTLVGGKQTILNGESVELVHYKGYRVIINNEGISIDGLDQRVIIQSNNSSVELNNDRIDIQASNISLNGNFEALYNKTPGVPITDVSQIGISKKVTLG